MKSEFYIQLQDLAREILDNPNADIESLQQTSRKLYEQLTIVRYTEELMEQFAELQSQSQAPDDEPDMSIQEPSSTPEQEFEHYEQEVPAIEYQQQEDFEDEQDDTIEELECVLEEMGYQQQEEEECSSTQEIQEESILAKQEEVPHETHTTEKKVTTPPQASLFDFDMFEDKEIGYDPEEELFEDKSGTQEIGTQAVEIEQELDVQQNPESDQVQEYTHTSFSGFQVLDDESPMESDDVTLEEQTLDEPSQDSVDEDYITVDHSTKITINELLAEEQPHASLNDRFASNRTINIGLNDRIAFTNHLFDGDSQAFADSISYISTLDDIGVAHEYIVEILKPAYKDWVDKQMYEKRFLDIVFAGFAKK